MKIEYHWWPVLSLELLRLRLRGDCLESLLWIGLGLQKTQYLCVFRALVSLFYEGKTGIWRTSERKSGLGKVTKWITTKTKQNTGESIPSGSLGSLVSQFAPWMPRGWFLGTIPVTFIIPAKMITRVSFSCFEHSCWNKIVTLCWEENEHNKRQLLSVY
jgi:hypothetical protein